MTPRESRTPLVVGIVLGTPFLAVGVYQVVSRGLDFRGIALWMAAGVGLHDLLLVPVVFAIGALLRRIRGARAVLAPVEAALVASGILLLFAVPALSGEGRSAADPSRLPGDYGPAVAALLVVIWVAAGCWALVRRHGRGRPE